jgi:RNA polymerase sigma factor (sigma-70 family)
MNDSDFSIIYKANYNDLYNYGLRLGFAHETCMDALHDVFYKLLAGKNTVELDEIRPYLFKSLKNRLIDIMRSKAEQADERIENMEELPFSVEVNIEDEMIGNEEMFLLKQKVETLMNLLTDRQREIIYLRYMEEMEYEDIGELLHMKASSVRKAVYRGIEILRKIAKS